MKGLWKTKISGFIKDNKRKKSNFRCFLNDNGRVLRKNYFKFNKDEKYKIENEDLVIVYNEDKKTDKKIEYKSLYGKYLVEYFDKKYNKKYVRLNLYFDKNFNKYFIYETSIELQKYLSNNIKDFYLNNTYNITLIKVLGEVDLDVNSYLNSIKDKKNEIKTEKFFIYDNFQKNFYQNRLIPKHFTDTWYTYGKMNTFEKKWTNKKDRLKTKQINKNLDLDHSLFFINYDDFDDEYFYYFNSKI